MHTPRLRAHRADVGDAHQCRYSDGRAVSWRLGKQARDAAAGRQLGARAEGQARTASVVWPASSGSVKLRSAMSRRTDGTVPHTSGRHSGTTRPHATNFQRPRLLAGLELCHCHSRSLHAGRPSAPHPPNIRDAPTTTRASLTCRPFSGTCRPPQPVTVTAAAGPSAPGGGPQKHSRPPPFPRSGR